MNLRLWRKMTWVIAAWSGLVLALTIVQLIQVAAKNCSSLEEAALSGNSNCIDIAVNGKSAVMVAWVVKGIVIWIIGFMVLAVIWFMTRQKVRTCPHCGENVAKGVTACRTCGYDFALGTNPTHDSGPAPVAPAPAPVASMPREGWYADSTRAGHTRWWDGAAWGIRDDEHPSMASATLRTDVVAANGAPVAPGSASVELGPEHADNAEIAVSAAEPLPETGQERAVTATAVESYSEAPPAAASTSAPEPDSPLTAQPRFCENCGAARSPTGRFCTNCGHA